LKIDSAKLRLAKEQCEAIFNSKKIIIMVHKVTPICSSKGEHLSEPSRLAGMTHSILLKAIYCLAANPGATALQVTLLSLH
jgi:hypothetical protein